MNAQAFLGHGDLAFVSLGGLFVLDGTTGKVTTVADQDAVVTDPLFSPNRKWLAYSLGSGRIGVARSNGSDPRTIPSDGPGANWLPDGALVTDGHLYQVTADRRPLLSGDEPPGLTAWSPDGDRFAFVTRVTTTSPDGGFRGVEQLAVSNSIGGPRTVWHSTPISFAPRSGFHGNVIAATVVLPDHEGVLVWLDPDMSDDADGAVVYEIRAPGGPLVPLGTTVGRAVALGPGGTFALSAGGDRYAWTNKYLETCRAATAKCTTVRTSPKELSLDPSYAPDGKSLAFVAAAPETDGSFPQSTIRRWYATHDLWSLATGSAHPEKITGTAGAASPIWAAAGSTLLFVADDALWLLPKVGATPEKIASPLFPQTAWASYYGQIDWTGQFAWSATPFAPPATWVG